MKIPGFPPPTLKQLSWPNNNNSQNSWCQQVTPPSRTATTTTTVDKNRFSTGQSSTTITMGEGSTTIITTTTIIMGVWMGVATGWLVTIMAAGWEMIKPLGQDLKEEDRYRFKKNIYIVLLLHNLLTFSLLFLLKLCFSLHLI